MFGNVQEPFPKGNVECAGMLLLGLAPGQILDCLSPLDMVAVFGIVGPVILVDVLQPLQMSSNADGILVQKGIFADVFDLLRTPGQFDRGENVRQRGKSMEQHANDLDDQYQAEKGHKYET